MDLSVILPTRNRAETLRETLVSLASQQVNGACAAEVLVVDNGSTDRTPEVVETLQQAFLLPLRRIAEPREGKSVALNTGIQHAQGAWLVFTDDDVVAEPGWLAGLWRCIQETGAQAIAGRVVPLWTDGRPAWLTDKVLARLGALGLFDVGPHRLTLHPAPREYWWVGSNIAVRRELLDRVGRFDPRRIRGQDTELYARCVAAGATIVYEPAATVAHRTGADRLTPAYFRTWHHRAGYYRAYSIPWRRHHLLTLAPLFVYREMVRWAARWVRSWCRAEPFWSRLADECRLRAAVSVWVGRAAAWPRECRRVLGTARRSVLCSLGIARLLFEGDATTRALGRALAVMSRKRLSRAEASWAVRIEALRGELEASSQTIQLENYGVGRPDARSSEGRVSVTTVGETCRRTSKSPRAAQLLMAIVRRARPERCLELGTSLGISGAYQAAALELSGMGRLVTLEGATAKAALARTHFQRLGLERVSVVTGRFQDTLPEVLRDLGRVDMAFVDGHHDEHATVAYFQQIVRHMPEGGVMVLDDIEWSDGMRRAWRSVRADERVRVAVTLGEMGMCVVGTPRRRAREIRVPLNV